jgi:hypothetical protein
MWQHVLPTKCARVDLSLTASEGQARGNDLLSPCSSRRLAPCSSSLSLAVTLHLSILLPPRHAQPIPSPRNDRPIQATHSHTHTQPRTIARSTSTSSSRIELPLQTRILALKHHHLNQIAKLRRLFCQQANTSRNPALATRTQLTLIHSTRDST